MNIRTSYVLLAVLTAVGTLSISGAFAQQEACPTCAEESTRMKANERLLQQLPISVTTDKTAYTQGDMITVEGKVANVASGFPVTLKVLSPKNNVVAVDQISVDSDGMFATSLNTAGDLWKYDGTYTIRVQYGTTDKSDKIRVQVAGAGIPAEPTRCGPSEIAASNQCIPFSINGGEVVGASIDTDAKSIIVRIDSTQEGQLTLNPSTDIIRGMFMVLVDDQEWRDSTIDTNNNSVTVMFPAGTEKIEVIGTFVIPEFGAIAALVLAVAIVSIIAVSAKSRLSLMPRY